jgi:multidrug resistance efflux pump
MQFIASKALLERYQQAAALTTGSYGEAAVEEANALRAVAEAKVATLETKLKSLQGERARLELRAPIDGLISATAFIYSGAEVKPGVALFKIAQPGAVTLRLRASEDRIASLKPGEKVRFRSMSNPDRLAPFAVATLTHITPERELTGTDPDAPKGDYLIEASVDKAPYPLPPGAAVEAEVVLGSLPFYRHWFQTPVK